MKFILIFLIYIFSAQTFAINEKYSISTSSGTVEGTKSNRVIFFEDIPYAQPPVGELRWKAPRKLISSQEIMPKEDNHCIQRPSNLGGANGDEFYTGSENCLYLDIFTPKKIDKNLSVMVWIHGGGNTSGLKDLYNFSKMVSKHDVIVVRINYRLGPFGWFTHPAIQDFQNGDDKSSNFGTLDIIMALEWVKENISKFGGDPNNVTIFGESAGGHNVLSLLVSKKAKGLFHKAITMSGYTTSITPQDAYKQNNTSSTSEYTSSKVVEKIMKNYIQDDSKNIKKTRDILKSMSSEDFFKYYSERKTYEQIPLLTSDGIAIPKIGLRSALTNKEHLNIVPTIAGSNRDEVKLWLATAQYFVDLDYSILGSLLNIPKVKLTNESAFEAFNYYRSSAWKIRGVNQPLNSLANAGNKNLYAYRYDWDDHRRLIVADFKKLIGAAHATEIPLLTGNTDLVGGYPLSDLIYPPSVSKRFLSKNMMQFWTNFAKTGIPGSSTNSIVWDSYVSEKNNSNFIILDNRKNLRMSHDDISFESLVLDLADNRYLTELEKCVVLLQMFTFVGDDLYDELIDKYPYNCERTSSEKFLKDNASFIEY